MPDIQQFLHKLSIYAVPVVLAITFHEAAHGYVAYRKGDPTAKMLGRVTLNPIPHIDPFGTILLPAMMILFNMWVVFGWARPVPVNFRLLHDQKRDPIYVAAAGVVTNLGLALLSGLERFLMFLYDEPDLVRRMVDMVVDVHVTLARRAVRMAARYARSMSRR